MESSERTENMDDSDRHGNLQGHRYGNLTGAIIGKGFIETLSPK